MQCRTRQAPLALCSCTNYPTARPGANAAPICAGFSLQPRGRAPACAARTGREYCCRLGCALRPGEGGSLGQPRPSPGTPFPSAHGPVLPITGPAASSCASAKAGDGVRSGCRGPAASQHLNPPSLGKTGWPKASLPCRQCLLLQPALLLPAQRSGSGRAGLRVGPAPSAWASHFRKVGREVRRGEAWRRRWGFAQEQEEMVISRWSVQEVREGGRGALEEVGSVSALLSRGPWEWGQ